MLLPLWEKLLLTCLSFKYVFAAVQNMQHAFVGTSHLHAHKHLRSQVYFGVDCLVCTYTLVVNYFHTTRWVCPAKQVGTGDGGQKYERRPRRFAALPPLLGFT